MYTRPCQSQLIRWNLSKCLANLNLTRTHATKPQDDFKILQVSDRRKTQRDFLPGIENRKELLREWDSSLNQNENEVVSTDMDPEEFNAMQADFMDVEKSYDSHHREQLMKRAAKIRSQVRKRHFREAKQPKLLTITEIYQIHLLHKENPVEWTVEKLSESFPATPAVILKVLNSHSFRSPERMLQHDLGVKHNWFLLQTGKLVGLSPDYEQHLSSFSYREPVVRTIDEYKTFIPPPFRYVPESTEYRSIITSYYDSVNRRNKSAAGDDQMTGEQSNTPSIEEGRKQIGMNSGGNGFTVGNNRTLSDRRISKPLGSASGDMFGKSMGRKQSKSKVGGALARWFSSSSTTNETCLDKSKTEEESDKVVSGLEEPVNNVPNRQEDCETNQDVAYSECKETERQLSDERSTENSNENPSVPSSDINRTMHSSKPAHWREIERQRQEKEIEKERVKAELDADVATHDGKWRRIKPNVGQGTFKPIENEFRHQYSDDNMNDEDDYRGGLDRNRMDLERIRKNRAPKASIMFDEEEEFLPEERYERIMQHNSEANSRIDSYRDESGAFELERSERESNHGRTEEVVDRAASSQGTEEVVDRAASSQGTEKIVDRAASLQETEEVVDRASSSHRTEDADVHQEKSGGPVSAGILLNPKSPDHNSSETGVPGTVDLNKRMYPKKPYHWDEIMRHRNREERERVADQKMIEEDMEDKSMYDGRWRRLRPRRTRGDEDPFFGQDNRPRVGRLITRRMDTLQNADDLEDSVQEQTLPQSSKDAKSISALGIPNQDEEHSVLHQESSQNKKARPKIDYYLEEGIDTQRNATHFTLDGLRQTLDTKLGQEPSNLDRDEEALLTSFEKKKRLHQSEDVDPNAGTQLTSYNTRSSQSDLLFTGTVNYTGIVSQGVDITERDVQVELANHIEMKIHIPKELYKEDSIYKVEDCFYDDQGEFLYRVPGLKDA